METLIAFALLLSVQTQEGKPIVIVIDNHKTVHVNVSDIRINAGEQIETITNDEEN